MCFVNNDVNICINESIKKKTIKIQEKKEKKHVLFHVFLHELLMKLRAKRVIYKPSWCFYLLPLRTIFKHNVIIPPARKKKYFKIICQQIPLQNSYSSISSGRDGCNKEGCQVHVTVMYWEHNISVHTFPASGYIIIITGCRCHLGNTGQRQRLSSHPCSWFSSPLSSTCFPCIWALLLFPFSG